MDAAIGGCPGVNPPHLGDTDIADEDDDNDGSQEKEDEDVAPAPKRRKNTGKERKNAKNGTAQLVETMQDGQAAFLDVMEQTHRLTMEQSYKMHLERESGREKSDSKMLEGFSILAGRSSH
jgi:hypothetical protein